MSKKKINIDVDYNNFQHDETFVCSLCGKKQQAWMMAHSGRYKICTQHNMLRVFKHTDNTSFEDLIQIMGAQIAIKELENARRT